MSILKSTNSGKRAYWHVELNQLCERIAKILIEKEVQKKNPLILFFDCPIGFNTAKKDGIDTVRCKLLFWQEDLLYTKNIIEEGFSNAVYNTIFSIEDISLNTIELKMQDDC